jgi:hypothetical protein
MSGRKHYDETHKKMSDSHKKIDHSGRFKTGEENPMFGKTACGENHPNFGKPRPEGAGRFSQVIEVFDLQEKTTTYYNSIREAARAWPASQGQI